MFHFVFLEGVGCHWWVVGGGRGVRVSEIFVLISVCITFLLLQHTYCLSVLPNIYYPHKQIMRELDDLRLRDFIHDMNGNLSTAPCSANSFSVSMSEN